MFNIYEFHAYLAERRPWARLDVGNPDIPPDPRIVEALRSAAGETGYSTFKGEKELVEAIASLHGVETDEVLIVPGGKFGIAASIYTSRVIGVVAPYWPAYRLQSSVSRSSLKVVAETRLEDGWEIREPNLEGIDTLVINYPNNPTGALPRGALKDLVEEASRRGIRIVSDEVYRDLVYDGAGEWSILDYSMENTIMVYSFSKTFSIPGYRIGYVVGDKRIVKEVARYVQAVYTSAPKPVQAAALKALEIRDEVARKVREIYMQRIEAFERHSRGVLEFRRPAGGMYIFARVKGHVDDVKLVYRLADLGVGAFPGSAFGESYKGFLRLTLTVEPGLVPKVVDAIRRAVEQ